MLGGWHWRAPLERQVGPLTCRRRNREPVVEIHLRLRRFPRATLPLRPVLKPMRVADRRQGHGGNVRPKTGDASQITVFLETIRQLLDGLLNTA